MGKNPRALRLQADEATFPDVSIPKNLKPFLSNEGYLSSEVNFLQSIQAMFHDNASKAQQTKAAIYQVCKKTIFVIF